MFKQSNFLCITLCTIYFSPLLQADHPGLSSDLDFVTPLSEGLYSPLEQELPAQVLIQAPVVEEKASPSPKKAKEKISFTPFTGKVKGKKVRLRLRPDVDSPIVRELTKGELLVVTGEAEDFWSVEAPSDLKAYISRNFVLDNKVEGSRVNVRLQPNLEAPILCHVQSGETVEGTVSTINTKWLEIPAPSATRLYVAKDYLEHCGGPEIKAQQEARFQMAKQQLEMAEYFVTTEMQKEYPNIDFDKMQHSFQVVIQDYPDFPLLAEKAKESLSQVQEQFLDKRIQHLEAKPQEELVKGKAIHTPQTIVITDKMKQWESVEESCYLAWFSANDSKNMDEYYDEQKLIASKITGILEPYLAPVKCKPGNYIVKHNDLPVAYVYSTIVNLQDYVGKNVTLTGSPRPNNNFAFPAYFIFSVEN